VKLRQFIPFFDTHAQEWSSEARWLRWVTFLWLAVGMVVMYSASFAIAESESGNGTFYAQRQLVFIAIGMVMFNVVVHNPLRWLLKNCHWFLLLFWLILLSTLLPGVGRTVNGATRWLELGPFLLQPSEFIKPFLVLQSARIFGQWDQLKWFTRLAWLGVFVFVLLCILAQPNLSTTALCGMLLWLIALAAGLPYSQLGATAFAGLLMATLSVSIRSYQRKRILSFLNPWADSQGDGYQLVQSLLAIGSGGTWGSGFGLSQQKLFYLPIQYTDFIFAVFAEEFGFAGTVLLLVMLAAYATLGFRVAAKCQQPVYRLVAIGVTILMVGQSLLNIGVASGALPTTGLPFPLVSYGGSSMMSSLLAAGLLVRVAREASEANVLPMQPGFVGQFAGGQSTGGQSQPIPPIRPNRRWDP
jgi:cell division protein FtsW